MTLRIVHFSKTPLAGAPIRIVGALKQHPSLEVFLIDRNRWGRYDHDLVHEEDPDRTLALCEEADIIHFYNYLDYDTTDFAPVDFRQLQRQGKRFVRHFQSTPMKVAADMRVDAGHVLRCPIPKLVIAQYPERFFPSARVVPNIVPQDAPHYLPPTEPASTDIVYTPTWYHSAWLSRWDTKGMPETVAMLQRLSDRLGCQVRCLQGSPLAEVMQEKRRAAIVIDELVTGSYHLSGLEGLSLGKPTLAYLDARTERVLRWISGADNSPFVNVRLEDAEHVLAGLLRDREAMREIGRAARAWIERYWTDRALVEHFAETYRLLMEDPSQVARQPELRVDGPAERFFSISLPHWIHHGRMHAHVRLGDVEMETKEGQRCGTGQPSSDLAPRLAAESGNKFLATFRRQGYCVVEELYPREVCRHLVKRLADLAAMAANGEAGCGDSPSRDVQLAGVDHSMALASQFAVEPLCLDLAARYLQQPIESGLCLAEITWARSELLSRLRGWHKDTADPSVRCVLYLTDMWSDQGTLRVVEGSQALLPPTIEGQQRLRYHTHTVHKLARERNLRMVDLTGNAGTCVLLDGALIHGLNEVGDADRFILTNYYMPPGSRDRSPWVRKMIDACGTAEARDHLETVRTAEIGVVPNPPDAAESSIVATGSR